MNQSVLRRIVLVTVIAAFVWSPAVWLHLGAQRPQGFPDLVGGLKSTPGCLGVETARTAGGKQVIFAWFENKQGLLNWYHSDTHRQAMRMLAPSGSTRPPLADLPDDGTPVLAIASVTMSEGAPGAAPFSQIAIELYRPAPGGLALGGRFAPATLKVPGLMDIAAAR